MSKINSFGIIGGDKRQITVAELISTDGYNVYVNGMEKINFYNNNIEKCNIDEVISKSKYIILPLPVTKDNLTINTPFSSDKIYIDKRFTEKLKGQIVFCGMKSKLLNIGNYFNDIKIYDYFDLEEVSVKNAVPTAEGAIEIAMREYYGTISGSSCLIAGFGRIGKVLAKMLKGIGANVTISARKKEDLAWINIFGYNAIKTCEICNTNDYDIIFNTIPYMIFDAHTLALCAENALVIDLASAPGGVDFEAAQRFGIKSIQALSLPGKVAPKTAGQIIKDTIYNIIEEEFK